MNRFCCCRENFKKGNSAQYGNFDVLTEDLQWAVCIEFAKIHKNYVHTQLAFLNFACFLLPDLNHTHDQLENVD